jgi:glycosyltransferase involved in cell wall biosynthesis
MKKILLITASFPYGKGEQFLETEIKYYKNINLTLLPLYIYEDKRVIDNDIKIENFIAENFIKENRYIALLNTLLRKVFYSELLNEGEWSIPKLKIFFSSIYKYQIYYNLFNKYFSNIDRSEKLIVYTYWNSEATYALESLKQQYGYKLVSRIHGGDLYQERRAYDYLPLKKVFNKDIDTLYTITQSANDYLVKRYKSNYNILKLSRLGVIDRGIISKESESNSLYILSCSFLTEVKQIDKIIYILKELSKQRADIKIYWRHIGDGVLYDKLTTLAREELEGISNIKYNFAGDYSNEEVYSYYADNKIDVFINVSISEGVPVSIMEAMSCHIPIIAPNIGGIKDMLVDGENGFLLSDRFKIDEVVHRLANIEFFKQREKREKSYKIFLEKYNADKNYREFINSL